MAPSGPDDVVIRTRGLSKQYPGGVTALSGLDLEVKRNSIFGFLGPNGAGKTTTIKLLLGLARPTAGSATLFGFDSERDTLEVRRRIGYLAQDPRYYDYMTARETLRFTAKFFFAGPGGELEQHIRDTLALVGLGDKADRPIKSFSGGERQRLGIAQAQISRPELLILNRLRQPPQQSAGLLVADSPVAGAPVVVAGRDRGVHLVVQVRRDHGNVPAAVTGRAGHRHVGRLQARLGSSAGSQSFR